MKNYLLILFVLLQFLGFSQKNETPQTNQKTLVFNQQVTSTDAALALFANEFKVNKGVTFVKLYQNTDRKGIVHEKFQQYYNGIKVEFGIAITHKLNGIVLRVNGELYVPQTENQTPVLSKQSGFTLAVNHVNATSYLWEDEVQAQLMEYKKPAGELVYFSNSVDKSAQLAYKYDIYATAPISRQIIYVAAVNGAVLFSNPIIKHADKLVNPTQLKQNHKEMEQAISNAIVAGNADTRYSGARTIETTFDATNYVLNDATRGNGIFTYNCQNSTNYQNTNFTDNDNNWSAVEYNNAAKDNGALDAHWGAERTFDFWNTVFNRNSFDDNGAAIRSYVHYDTGFDNAFWNGSVMTYGDGNSLDILTSIDVCGHEIGHAICSYTADLIYSNESGAMNEGYSDIWGACIEHFGRTGSLSGTLPTGVWLIGEDISNSSLRSMSNPNSKGDPDTYLGTFYYTGTADSGGVHTNSGVLNHWFYLLAVGGSGTNNAPIPDTYNVSGIGLDKAAEIAYLTERDYLSPNATFADARLATIEVASLLYCGNSPEAMAVTNAWYAVNVGEQYVAAADDVALKAIQTSDLISCSAGSMTTNITLKNEGLNPIATASIAYTIDGGSVMNSTFIGAILPCGEATHPITVSGLTRGAHILSVTVTIVNDGRVENNTKSATLLVNDAGTVGVINPFTTASDALITYNEGTSGAQWVRGVRTGIMTSSGNTVYTTNLTGNYPDMIKSYLVSQCYNLSTITNPQISFAMKYDLEENWDIVYVEYSTDFGANWSVLGTMGSTWYTSDRTLATAGNDCYNCPGAQWTGTNLSLTTYSYPLTALNSETNVIFRIVFHTDEAVNQKGVNVDDFVITGTLSSPTFEDESVEIYPNPSNGLCNISWGTFVPTAIEIYDVTGKIIATQKEFQAPAKETSIDLAHATQGIYFVKITGTHQTIVKRIIKE